MEEQHDKKGEFQLKKRINPSSAMKASLLKKNKGVCCVCKERGLGLEFNHIDEDPTNTCEENLAVLCVKDHDQHHRPKSYSKSNHLELGADHIREYKISWETFVEEAAKTHPKILAVMNGYGIDDYVHSVNLVLQWIDGKVEFERNYHLREAPPEVWINKIIEELEWLGKGIILVPMPELLEVKYCPHCQVGDKYNCLYTTVDNNVVKKITADSWNTDSLGEIYINPQKASLAITILLKEEIVFDGRLHKCGKTLHFHYEKREERIPIYKKAVRTQVTELVKEVLTAWQPSRTLIGTGNPNSPTLIKELLLPKIWEK